ncbi:hypothetical protein HAHE_06720 [Haloferula helveola]|uniref:Uncharacterized protein n=1 Tax=Haloferula helveola TaxID=490095 RepID=A0ABM7R992_9BACT|nr:hypothetical protein HAHE_06720 [Haloferula helveola]
MTAERNFHEAAQPYGEFDPNSGTLLVEKDGERFEFTLRDGVLTCDGPPRSACRVPVADDVTVLEIRRFITTKLAGADEGDSL